MYLKLESAYVLRGWQRLPYVLIRRPENTVRLLTEDEFNALRLCNGLCDCGRALVPAHLRAILRREAARGVVRECAYGDTLAPEQEYRRYENRFIRSVHWSITGRCNYRCKHCYLSAPSAKLGELPHETMLEIIEQLAACGVQQVSLTGGEPLVRGDWWQLVDALTRHRIAITAIYSNGALVNAALLDGLEQRGLRPAFSMSYDGDAGWHDWLRGIPGAGEAALRAFDLCRDRGFATEAELCLHRGNCPLLRQSVNTLAAHHCAALKVNPVSDTELWRKYGGDYALSMEDAYQTYLNYIPAFFADGAPLSLMMGGFFYCQKGGGHVSVPMKKYSGGPGCLRHAVCGHARQSLYLSPEGRLLPCLPLAAYDLQAQYPRITEIGLRQGLTDSKYLALIDTRVEDLFAHTKECRACSHALVCAGGCRARALADAPTDILAPDRACCLFFKGGWAGRLEAVLNECAAGPQAK
ncbi:hypothetical protein CE91St44_26940 [Oscillospiraceae bacterium]|nr:hypothetical protein CE91St44_26940 [Oscillospiraceae bacterium]